MNALAVLLVAATFAVDYGWTNRTDGGVEYIIQIEPALAEALRSGELPEGVASEIVPQVQNVRAFRIVIGDDALPREAQAAASTPDVEPASHAVPHSSMLAADTAPDLRSRYGFNPRYAAPEGETPAITPAVKETAESIRASTNQALGNAANNASAQIQNEASRLQQGLNTTLQNGVQNAGNALRGAVNPQTRQPAVNPAAAGQPQFAAQPTTATDTRFTPGYGTTDANGNPLQPAPYATDQYGRPQQQPYTDANAQAWPPQATHLQNQGQWPQANPNQAQPGTAPAGNYANQTSGAWPPAREVNNWQTGTQPAAVPNAQAYQPQPQPGYWQQQAPAQPQVPYQYPQQPQAPPLLQPNNYGQNPPYLAANPPQGNGGLPVQPVSQPIQPPNASAGTNSQPVPVVRNTGDASTSGQAASNTQGNGENTGSGPSSQISRRSTGDTSSRGVDPDLAAWVSVWLLIISVCANGYLAYIASNFHKQTRKLAMQLRRVRTN